MSKEVFSCEEIDLSEKIGEGSFGMVFKGELNHPDYDNDDVAVKIMKRTDAVKELQRMSKLDHPNVVKLIEFVPKGKHHDYCGCVGIQRGLWLVLEYVPFGSLQEFVSDRRGGLKAATMDRMSYQIAFGMDYLHRIANLVHRDLAARNILVDANDNVKIADFGLCNDYNTEDQYYYLSDGKPCPIRWMPPENLPDYQDTYAHFSRKGDVWSFGVVLFEIWSRGSTPYGHLENEEVISAVKGGTTLLNDGGPKLHARSWVVSLMEMCFEYNKEERPNFRWIYEYIDENSEYDLH